MNPRLYAYALRTARPRQLRARALRPVLRRRFPAEPAPSLTPLVGAAALWHSPAFEPTELAGAGTERLRSFHAHYGEDVLGHARARDAVEARAAMTAWIAANPPRPGDAWHPYTTSTRAGNWIAALALVPEAETSEIRESLWRQLLHLERNVEDDVLGNHVIRNARALALGGTSFSSARLAERAAAILARELPEQVLPDGGHYERSPVYHLVVLRDLLEVEAAVPGAVPGDVLERMRRFAAALARPDGEPALFNDGTLDLAPQLELPAPADGLTIFPETGYAVWRREGLWLAFDCGSPSPAFLPAHAHADALSFQLWLGGKPVVIDPGMPTYEAGVERDWFRGTRAHSTVSIDGRDQFELWGAFRSGPLPRVELLHASGEALAAVVEWPCGVRHTRRLVAGAGALDVVDRVEGRGRCVLTSSLALGAGAGVRVRAGGSQVRTGPRTVSERLFVREHGEALVASTDGTLPQESSWAIDLR
jgi:hypothetical protein